MENTYKYSPRALPLDSTWDVIVVGGGPTGCAAAIASAREGARTLLIESTGALGGSGTNALVPSWCPFSDKEKIIYRGLAEKIFAAAKEGMAHVKASAMDWVPINAEKLKRVYDDFLSQAGVEVLFHTVLSAVEKRCDQTVSTLIVSNKSGLSAVQAKMYVDCTGDADLAAWAGADFQKGDIHGDLQPATHCFVLTNVDEYAYRYGPSLHPNNPQSPIHAIIASGKYPDIPDTHLCDILVGPRTVGFNAGHLWDIDNTDPRTVSQALSKGRRMAESFRRALAEFFPEAFANAFLVNTGSVIGIRETRRVIGDYVLSLDDYLERRCFEDEICRNAYFIDLHFTKEEVRKKSWVDVEKRFTQYAPGESHGIPYRCLTPRGLKNVLVAGRSISCEKVVHGSIRVMPVCLATGEAAGLSAALAIETQNAHKVDVRKLRAKLQGYGAYLPPVSGAWSEETKREPHEDRSTDKTLEILTA